MWHVAARSLPMSKYCQPYSSSLALVGNTGSDRPYDWNDRHPSNLLRWYTWTFTTNMENRSFIVLQSIIMRLHIYTRFKMITVLPPVLLIPAIQVTGKSIRWIVFVRTYVHERLENQGRAICPPHVNDEKPLLYILAPKLPFYSYVRG